eukprot:1755107-Alexandrium_andersonii.AAC.1
MEIPSRLEEGNRHPYNYLQHMGSAGAPFARRFSLGWANPGNALLFFIFFRNYHWGSARDANPRILSVRNQGFDE